MTKNKMNSLTISTIKRLYAVSGNQCAYPGCTIPLVEESGTVTGEIAHIKAASKNGPRYDESQTEDERNSYGNLLLLCSRHHTIIDAEILEYPIEKLKRFKESHEQAGLVEITPHTLSVAQVLLNKYQSIVIKGNSGQVAINSPGVIQANNLHLKTTKNKISISPPEGSIASNLEMRSYTEYLISRYQDYQKQDKGKEDKYKYIAIYNAIRKKYGCKWQLIPEVYFEELISFLQNKIDNTKIGRIRKNRDQKRYHRFEEHIKGDMA